MRFTVGLFLLIFALAVAVAFWPEARDQVGNVLTAAGNALPAVNEDGSDGATPVNKPPVTPTNADPPPANQPPARTIRIALPDCVGKVKWDMSASKVDSICKKSWEQKLGGDYYFVHYPSGKGRSRMVKFKFVDDKLRSFTVTDKISDRKALNKAFKKTQDRLSETYGVRSIKWSGKRPRLALSRDNAKLHLIRPYTARK